MECGRRRLGAAPVAGEKVRRADLHLANRLVSHHRTVVTDDSAGMWDVAALDAYADGFYVMGYDEHFYDSDPNDPNKNGPVDSLGLAQQSA